ncbi:beta-glucosidase [Motilibacter peucedani]|uniref:Exo-alpha-(1->6)-L-arabinopyranosidase n=1 Tax=Motilibacter peucedani TaxID=598650 RepID=A0A420XNN5_9ACTN|nr:glycoside hydrolase family 3 N-terminal domain-containing protein [Motilibacter peucedani]RKS73795.1 beta-glucosidase [Motilibacter peucedani]
MTPRSTPPGGAQPPTDPDDRPRVSRRTLLKGTVGGATLAGAGLTGLVDPLTAAAASTASAGAGSGGSAALADALGSTAVDRTATAVTPEIRRKVDALLARMTLQEKLGQLQMQGGDVDGAPNDDLVSLARRGMVGTTLGVRGAANVNKLQRAALASRLGIPLLFAFDVIHGYRTIFPTPLGESASWDPSLARAAARVAAVEATAAGIRWTFAPMADVTHDARWGRIVEGAGEDPYLGSAFAVARVRGFQGSDISAPQNMAACVKHFAAYGGVESGREYNTVDVSVERLWNTYLPPYHAAVNAGVATVMTSFNDISGVPSTGNPELLQDILRGRWAFDGLVVSDYTSVLELVAHGYAADPADAARLALTAGTDIEMVSTTYHDNGRELLLSKEITRRQLDDAVRRVLTLKHLTGMFDRPFATPARESVLLSAANRAVARRAVADSVVLLRNEGGALPLSPGIAKIAVIGPLADSGADMIGSWSGDGRAEDSVTVLAGLKAAYPSATVTYTQGCDPVATTAPDLAPAVAAAAAADLVVLVVGEPAALSGEASARSDIGLPGHQEQLVETVAAVGKPYVVVLVTGRPLALPWIAEHAPALLVAWHPGTEAGNGIADVLLGKVNPSGKLTAEFPRAVGQLPLYYSHRSTGRPFTDPTQKYQSRYLDVDNSPQFPFGFGLSYTTFELSRLSLSRRTIGSGGSVTVTAAVKNTGTSAGAEVVQLYFRDKVASLTQPVRRLAGFHKVQLAPGQSRWVTFTVRGSDLGFFDNAARKRVEAGEFDIWVGNSSTGGLHTTLHLR